MNYEIIGNTKQLLGMHGDVNTVNAIEALKCMSDNTTIDINEINKVSETGGIYVTSDGRILNTFEDLDESKAKYKIVPTGLLLKGTNYPLFASFMKSNNFWEGVYISTGYQLFEMYKNHYKPIDAFSSEYVKIFGGINKAKDITGFGLASIIKDVDNVHIDEQQAVVYSSEDDDGHISAMQAAFEKMKGLSDNNTSKTSAKSSKKANRLQAHIEKMQQAKSKEANTVEGKNDTSTDIATDIKDNDSCTFVSELDTCINNEDINDNPGDAMTENVELITDNEVTLNVSDEMQTIHDMDHDFIQDTKRNKYSEQSKRELLNSIYEKLLDKVRWGRTGNYKSKLGFYLKGICLVIWQQQKQCMRENGWLYSTDGTKSVINTGLLDTFGNYIYLVDNTPELPDFYDKELNIMYNKTILIDLGFDIDSIKNLPEPMKLVDDTSKLIFRADIADFDLDDDLHFTHIIHERINKFPDKYKDMSDVEICNKIKSSITQAVKISKTDYRYMIPKYDFYKQDIQFLMPLYLDASINERPELALVIGRENNPNVEVKHTLVSIYTVLSLADAYDDAQFFGYPNSTWLKP